MERSLTEFLFNNFRQLFIGPLTETDLHILHLARRGDATVSLYVFENGSPSPVCEVKMVRTAEEVAILRNEYNALKRVQSMLADRAIAASLPTPIGLADLNGSAALILGVPPGKLLSRILAEDNLGFRPGHRARRTLLRCSDWLLRFQKATVGEQRSFRLEVPESVEGFIRNSPATDAGRYRALFDRLARLKMEAGARAVASNGRLSVNNVYVSRAGVAVTDWAHYCDAQHPFEDLLDLFFSANRLLTKYGRQSPFAFLTDATSWLHGLFLESTAATCSEFDLATTDMRDYTLCYCLRDLGRSIKTNDQEYLTARLELIKTLIEVEPVS